MYCFFSLLLFCCIAGTAAIPTNASDLQVADGIPDSSTPKSVTEVWLRFHETGLCQGVNAVFSFRDKGMEVTGTIVDEKSFEKLQEMVQPLRSSYEIVLKLDQPKEVPKTDDNDKGKDPPASLWENYELRSFLGDPYARARERPGFDDESQARFPPPDEFLKQRLLIYSNQTLEWNGQIENYAKHLPALTRLAAEAGLPPDIRSHANAVAAAHAKEMVRLLGKLSANLEPALPHSGKNRPGQHAKSALAPRSISSHAENISEFAQAVCSRVYHFIHPEHYTVGLDELRQPSLLESVKDLQKMNSDFLKSLAKLK